MFAGILISAVAIFLGIFTRLPQGGGGLVNNLMVLTFFLPAPPLLLTLPPKTTLFDLEAAIAENELYYIRNPVVARNGTQEPIPRPSHCPVLLHIAAMLLHQAARSKSRRFRSLRFLFPRKHSSSAWQLEKPLAHLRWYSSHYVCHG